MNYISTRGNPDRVPASQAILAGISKDGGLFVPETIPRLSEQEIEALSDWDYCQTAEQILSLFLTDFSSEELQQCISQAYGCGGEQDGEKFDADNKIALSRVDPKTYLLELWHGPTAAFKDMALQLLPQLMQESVRKSAKSGDNEIVLLAATSGDTGKAAMEGFRDVPGTRMIVFYPEDGVSPMQRLQMETQEGENLQVAALRGTFDDAQAAVKKVFTDRALAETLQRQGVSFSSANSINWGRLVPQIVYYFAAYAQLRREQELDAGEPVNIAVPTGNFGNILAAWYAKQMGLPVGKLICGSNRNRVLADFLESGRYSKNRQFYQTISPSMDILVSSNLERLLFELCGRDAKQTAEWMESLNRQGEYTVSEEVRNRLGQSFAGGSCDDAQTKETIGALFQACGYLCDPHTAVAFRVNEEYRQASGDQTKTIVVSTASPYKFPSDVLAALQEIPPADELEAMKALEEKSKVPIPKVLAALEGKKVRFSIGIEKEEIQEFVERVCTEKRRR